MSAFLHTIVSRQHNVNRLFDPKLLGLLVFFHDESSNNGDSHMYTNSGLLVKGVLAKNGSGSAIAPGTAIKWNSGIDNVVAPTFSVAGAGDTVDGWVDPVGSKSVGDGETCLVVIAGPVRKVAADAETFAKGDLVKSAANGKVTAALAKTDAGYCGVVIEATTTVGEDVAVLAELRDSVNQYIW